MRGENELLRERCQSKVIVLVALLENSVLRAANGHRSVSSNLTHAVVLAPALARYPLRHFWFG